MRPQKKQHTSPPERWIKHFRIWRDQVVSLLLLIHKNTVVSFLDLPGPRILSQDPAIPQRLERGITLHGFQPQRTHPTPRWLSHALPAWPSGLTERAMLPLPPPEVPRPLSQDKGGHTDKFHIFSLWGRKRMLNGLSWGNFLILDSVIHFPCGTTDENTTT